MHRVLQLSQHAILCNAFIRWSEIREIPRQRVFDWFSKMFFSRSTVHLIVFEINNMCCGRMHAALDRPHSSTSTYLALPLCSANQLNDSSKMVLMDNCLNNNNSKLILKLSDSALSKSSVASSVQLSANNSCVVEGEVGGGEYGEEEDESAYSQEALSHFIFLSPTWLNRAIEGVMDKESMDLAEKTRYTRYIMLMFSFCYVCTVYTQTTLRSAICRK